MDYCGPLGLPHSTFLGWSRPDRDAAITWTLRRAHSCSACATRPDEWDPERGGSDHAYRAEVRGCRGCETVASAQDALKGLPGHARIVLVPNREAL